MMSYKIKLLENLAESVHQLVSVCRNIDNPNAVVYPGWTVKHVLGHITFWHESFALNVSDLVEDRKTKPLRGTYKQLSQRCIAEFSSLPMDVIVSRLEESQQSIQKNILNPKLVLIPYRVGSRDYTPDEHLQVVSDHIKEHTKDIKNAI
jgi:hypothetical protein